MSLSALALVLGAGGLHASWNLLAKKSGGGSNFVMLYCAITCLIWWPLALYLASRDLAQLRPANWGWIAASGLLHFVYALVLQRGYQVGDLSVVYPVARGSGPLLSSLGAIVLLQEAASGRALAGALLVTAGILLLAGFGQPSARNLAPGLRFGFATGLCIACYTLVDGYTVRTIGLAPPLLDFLSNTVRTAILLPVIVRRRRVLAGEARRHGPAAFGVALLMPLAYILVLYAMRLAPVSHVAPAREVSMLFGVMAGAAFLGEKHGWRRLPGALLIMAGVALIATAR